MSVLVANVLKYRVRLKTEIFRRYFLKELRKEVGAFIACVAGVQRGGRGEVECEREARSLGARNDRASRSHSTSPLPPLCTPATQARAFTACKPGHVRDMMKISSYSQVSWILREKVTINYGPTDVEVRHWELDETGPKKEGTRAEGQCWTPLRSHQIW